jgi:hypothetical protein
MRFMLPTKMLHLATMTRRGPELSRSFCIKTPFGNDARGAIPRVVRGQFFMSPDSALSCSSWAIGRSSGPISGYWSPVSPPLPATTPPRARAFAVDRLDRVRAEPHLVLTAEEVEQHAHPLCAVHARAQPEVIAEGITQDAHARSGPQPAKLDCAVALTGGYRRSRRRARRPAHAPLLTMPHSPRL